MESVIPLYFTCKEGPIFLKVVPLPVDISGRPDLCAQDIVRQTCNSFYNETVSTGRDHVRPGLFQVATSGSFF